MNYSYVPEKEEKSRSILNQREISFPNQSIIILSSYLMYIDQDSTYNFLLAHVSVEKLEHIFRDHFFARQIFDSWMLMHQFSKEIPLK